MNIYAIIVAGGSGSRMGADKNKVLLDFCGKSVLRRTVEKFSEHSQINKIIVVTRKCDRAECKTALNGIDVEFADGGDTRQKSVFSGLKKCDNADYVLIHDAARALIETDTITNVIADCIRYKAAAVGVKCKDTLKTVDENGCIVGTVDREFTYNIQTPQAFLYDDILKAHQKAEADAVSATDDCALIEHYGGVIKLTEGSYDNIKLTTPDDMAVGEMILKRRGGF